jgi:tripartite-type tricarboxylate transporter receptor subunit TctC
MRSFAALRTTGRRTLLVGAIAAPFVARAETSWPSRPVRIVVPFAAGGAIDATAREIGDALASRLGQQVLVDAKPGAGTIAGSDLVAKAAPDGYTFLLTTNSTHTNTPALFANLPFNPAKDLIPVSLVSLESVLIVAKGDASFRDLRSMASWAKGLGRPARYGSWGVGSPGHLYGLMLEKALGGYYNHVPYRNEAAALQDVVKGTLDLTWTSPLGAKPHVADGRIKPIAAAGAKRSAAVPDVSTFAEQLVPGFDLSLFVAVYAPVGTPPEIVDRLQGEIRLALATPQVSEKLIAHGQTPVGSSAKELATILQRETPLWAELIKQSGAKAEQ